MGGRRSRVGQGRVVAGLFAVVGGGTWQQACAGFRISRWLGLGFFILFISDSSCCKLESHRFSHLTWGQEFPYQL